jgi:predicted nucleic acid-binding protein
VILADSSAWVEFDRATGSPVHTRMVEAMTDAELAVTEAVLMEVTAGARSAPAAAELRRLLTSFEWIQGDVVADFEGAATIYRACRAKGITPRGLIDCMIANVAMRADVRLLSADRDFAQMATVVPLQLDAASAR